MHILVLGHIHLIHIPMLHLLHENALTLLIPYLPLKFLKRRLWKTALKIQILKRLLLKTNHLAKVYEYFILYTVGVI